MTVQPLPVSRERVSFRPPDGHDEILIARPDLSGLDLYVAVLDRLAPPEDASMAWAALPRADVDAAFLALRRQIIGEQIVAEITCAQCGGKGDLTFPVGYYLAAHAPARLRRITCGAEGWWQCDGARFRPPTNADIGRVAAKGGTPAVQAAELESLSIEAATPAGRRIARLALARVAPILADVVAGACPDCRARIDAWFDPAEFVVAELRQHAVAVFEEVHLLAREYGWSEAAILDLPRWRRARYAALIAPVAPSVARAARG